MLIIFRPEQSNDPLELRIYDTVQDRCFYTADDMILVNSVDIADRLDDFVGLNKKDKSNIVIKDLVENDQTAALIKDFMEC